MEKLRTKIEIRKTSEGKIECSGGNESSGTVISTETSTTVVEFSGNHIILPLADGKVSVKLRANKATPKVVFAGDGNRISAPLQDRGRDVDPSGNYVTAGITVDENTAVIVFVPKPKVMGPEMKRRVKAYKNKRAYK